MAGQIVLSRGEAKDVPTPSSGKSTLFVDETDGLFKLKDDEGNLIEVGGGGAVDSVFGRTGAVTAQEGDYSASDITGLGTAATKDAGSVSEASKLLNSDGLKANGKGWVEHGSTKSTARPIGFASIEWRGSVTPDNMTEADTLVLV